MASDWQPEDWWFQYDIAMVNTAGGTPVRITASGAYDNFPAWSPDGTRIAFLSARQQSLHGDFSHLAVLYTMAPDGSNVWDLSSEVSAVVNHPPQWSPDGRHLAFVGEDDERKHWLYTVAADGTQLTKLTPTIRAPVAWSPDGQRLAFAQAEHDTVALVTIAADGTGTQRVTTIDGWQPQYGDLDPTHAWIRTLAWSPTGEHILFACGHAMCISSLDGEVADISSLPLEGSPVPPQGEAFAAAWSPDGTRIAVVNYQARVTSPRLYLVAPDGTDVQVLVRNGGGRSLYATRVRRPKTPTPSAEQIDLAARHAACSAGLVVREPADNPDLVRDCETLVELRPQLMGALTLNWAPETPIEAWVGVTVAGTPPRVTALKLGSLGLTGELPSAIGRLTQLRELDLARNALAGPIPAELAQLTSLEELDLSTNQLTGRIPMGLGAIASLESVFLYGNKLGGCIPPRLAQLESERSDLHRLELPTCEASTRSVTS